MASLQRYLRSSAQLLRSSSSSAAARPPIPSSRSRGAMFASPRRPLSTAATGTPPPPSAADTSSASSASAAAASDSTAAAAKAAAMPAVNLRAGTRIVPWVSTPGGMSDVKARLWFPLRGNPLGKSRTERQAPYDPPLSPAAAAGHRLSRLGRTPKPTRPGLVTVDDASAGAAASKSSADAAATAAAAAEADPEAKARRAVRINFRIERTPSRQLPVYVEYRRVGGFKKPFTVIRKVEGDVRSFVEELVGLLGRVKLDVRPGKIVVAGNRAHSVRLWMAKLGF